MCTDDREEVVSLEELASRVVPAISSGRTPHSREEVTTPSDVVVHKVIRRVLFRTEIFERVRPEDITHDTLSGWLSESVDRAEIIQRM